MHTQYHPQKTHRKHNNCCNYMEFIAVLNLKGADTQQNCSNYMDFIAVLNLKVVKKEQEGCDHLEAIAIAGRMPTLHSSRYRQCAHDQLSSQV